MAGLELHDGLVELAFEFVSLLLKPGDLSLKVLSLDIGVSESVRSKCNQGTIAKADALRIANPLLVSLLQLLLSPLQLLLEHGDLSRKVLSGSLVSLALISSALVAVQTSLGLVQTSLGDLELTLERGDVLLLLEDSLLGLFTSRNWCRSRVSLQYACGRSKKTISHNLVGLLGLFRPLLSGFDLLAELVNFL